MLGRVFFFSMLINTCQQCCLQKRFIQTSIPLGSNHDQHRRQTSTSPSLLTAQGGEQLVIRCSFQPLITNGARLQSDPQHGESRNPDLEKCWSKIGGTMPLCLRANSWFSLFSEYEIPKVQCTFLLAQEVLLK